MTRGRLEPPCGSDDPLPVTQSHYGMLARDNPPVHLSSSRNPPQSQRNTVEAEEQHPKVVDSLAVDLGIIPVADLSPRRWTSESG